MFNLFRDWFHRNQLCDLGFTGPSFTWSRGSLHKQLDKCLCNEDWLRLAPETVVYHFPRIHSNHRSLLALHYRIGAHQLGHRPFRFLVSWLRDHRFANFVKSASDGSKNYMQMIEEFKTNLWTWNREVFGNIFKRKRRILARIGGIQKALEVRQSNHLTWLKADLRQELEEVLTQEEIIWY